MFAIKTPTEPRTEPQVAEERRDKSRPGPASEAAAARRAAASRLAVNIRAAQPPSPAQAGRHYKYFPFWQIFFRRFLTSSSRLIIGPTDPLNLKSCLISPGDNVDAGHDECNQTRFFRLHPILRVSKLMKIFLYYYKYFYIAINIFRKMM